MVEREEWGAGTVVVMATRVEREGADGSEGKLAICCTLNGCVST